MRKAWELAQELYWNAKPVVLSEEDQTWTANLETQKFYDQILSLDWGSHVPGSGAPERIMAAAVQALENRGYRVSVRGYELLEEGIRVQEEGDYVKLHKISAELRYELAHAEKEESASYWKYKQYTSFEQYEKAVDFPEKCPVTIDEPKFRERLKAAWLSQMIGAAMGTMVEGYTSQNLYEAFGDVYDYLRGPIHTMTTLLTNWRFWTPFPHMVTM